MNASNRSRRLAGKVAVVTGGASGIGAAIASGFALEGALVLILDVASEDQTEHVLSEIRQFSADVSYVQVDVSSACSVQSAFESVFDRFGRVDILVNCAGIFTEALLADMSVEEWDRVIAVNLRGVFLCTRSVINQMIAQGSGRIINIASQLGQIGGVAATHYSASKAGVIGFTKALSREVAKAGVLVNAIAPGPIETPLLDSESEEWRSAKLAELPIGRFGSVGEVVPSAILLASDDGSYYVGQTLGPNGGDVML